MGRSRPPLPAWSKRGRRSETPPPHTTPPADRPIVLRGLAHSPMGLTFEIIHNQPAPSAPSVSASSVPTRVHWLPQQAFTGGDHRQTRCWTLATGTGTKGCPSSGSPKRLFGRERVSDERGLRWGRGRIKPPLYSGVGSDAGLGSTVGAVGTPGWEAHTLASVLPSYSGVSQSLRRRARSHSLGPTPLHLRIPQVLINITHFQSSTG